jgi:5-methyltetrahydrofolate--homocysteine methyltransferase
MLDNIPFRDVADLIDREALFASRWQFRKGQTTEEWKTLKQKTIDSIFDRLILQCESKSILEAKLIYGYFRCEKQGDNALLVSDEHGRRMFRFEFPRRRQEPLLCVADFFPDGFIIMQIATIGDKVIAEGARLFQGKKFADAFYLKGLAAEMAEATAEYGHRFIRNEIQVPGDQGCRFSLGYPVAPNLMDQKKLFTLLKGEKVGVRLTETFHLVPEYSTSAIISVAPQAKLFRI